jgi:hypothetical protein
MKHGTKETRYPLRPFQPLKTRWNEGVPLRWFAQKKREKRADALTSFFIRTRAVWYPLSFREGIPRACVYEKKEALPLWCGLTS